jgi:hypothetical protein
LGAQIIGVTGKLPPSRVLYIAVLDRIVMRIVEMRPKIAFATNARIPITVPNLAARNAVPNVKLL